jgi:hypothetical protein
VRFAPDKNQHCCPFLTANGANGVVANQRGVQGRAFEKTSQLLSIVLAQLTTTVFNALNKDLMLK